MPAYSFQQRFVPFVLDGSKSQTVRTRRRHPAKAGSKLFLYYGLRTKWAKKLREETCSQACSIALVPGTGIILFDRLLTTEEMIMAISNPTSPFLPLHRILSTKERDEFAWKDGFRPDGTSLKDCEGSYELMLRFWQQTHELPWAGDVILWEPSTVNLP